MVRRTDHSELTIAVDWDVKNQINQRQGPIIDSIVADLAEILSSGASLKCGSNLSQLNFTC